MSHPLRVAIVARSVYPLHGHGGLERHVYDLTRYLADAGIEVTLITRETKKGPGSERPADSIHPGLRLITVPYRTFPLAGRRGTTVIDRSTAYPLFGERAGRVALDLVKRGEVDIVHGFGASVLGYASRRAAGAAPLVLNPQGLEEFGATDPADGAAQARRLSAAPPGRPRCAKAADCIIATDRVLEPRPEHLQVPRRSVRLSRTPSICDGSTALQPRPMAHVRPADGNRARRRGVC